MHNLYIVTLKQEVTRSQFVSVSAASAHLHHLCGTTFCLNWRPALDISRQGFKSSLKSWLFERAYS